MPRHGLPPFRTLIRLLAISIALVVASKSGAVPEVQATSAAAVASFVERQADPSLKAGGRVEPRDFPAALSDRLPAVVPHFESILQAADSAVGDIAHIERRADDRRASIVKHVPRLERGDPPRV